MTVISQPSWGVGGVQLQNCLLPAMWTCVLMNEANWSDVKTHNAGSFTALMENMEYMHTQKNNNPLKEQRVSKTCRQEIFNFT